VNIQRSAQIFEKQHPANMTKSVACAGVEPEARMLVAMFVPFWERTPAVEPVTPPLAASTDEFIGD